MTRSSPALDRKYAAMRLHCDEQCQRMAARFMEGASYAQLRREFGGSTYAVRGAIVRGGGTLPVRNRKVDEAELSALRDAVAAGGSVTDAAKRLGRPPTTLFNYARRLGIKASPRRGPRSGTWEGGRWMAHGYVYVWVAADDRLAVMRNQMGYVLEHRLVMARSLGRPLDRYETVHHINGDPTDNRLENLQLRQGRHGKGIAMRCRSCGSHDLEPTPLSFRA